MEQIKISLVVPIYKVERFVAECVHSIMSQLPDNCEVIFVDDGSPDQSMRIVREVLSEFPGQLSRIQKLTQSNQGPSAARNAGIKHASGVFVAFLDSDDVLDSGYFDVLLKRIDQNPDTDIIAFNCFSLVESDGVFLREAGKIEKLKKNDISGLSTPKQRASLLRTFANGAWFPWSRIYRRELFETLLFPSGMKYEDMWLVPQLYLAAKIILNVPEELVGYRTNIDGIMRNPNVPAMNDVKSISRFYIQKSQSSCDLELFYFLAFCATLFSAFHISRAIYGTRRARIEIRTLQKEFGYTRFIVLFCRTTALFPKDHAFFFISPELFLVKKKLTRIRNHIASYGPTLKWTS